MPKKKTEEEVVEAAETTGVTGEETAVEAQNEGGAENAATEAAPAETEAPAVEETASADTEDAPKKGGSKKAEATDGDAETSIVDSVIDTVSSAVNTVAETVSSGVSTVVSAVTGGGAEEVKKTSKRAERIGIVASDKMTKTVTVRVDRQVKHPIYRKYIKRRKKFMAHDELGAAIGDKVRIIETRPLSAKKRWRVVEIIQKAEK
jgi:small subunit ribosomal protein S17